MPSSATRPLLDKLMLVLMGNHHAILDQVARGDQARVAPDGGMAPGVREGLRGQGCQPRRRGAVEAGRNAAGCLGRSRRSFRRDPAPDRDRLWPARWTTCGLPHPVHLHGMNLGVPGNWETTLEGMRALDGHRVHMAHIQFHSYGGSADQKGGFGSMVGPLADHVNSHEGLTVDVGQVLFGETTSMTADGRRRPVPRRPHRAKVAERRHRAGGRLRSGSDHV